MKQDPHVSPLSALTLHVIGSEDLDQGIPPHYVTFPFRFQAAEANDCCFFIPITSQTVFYHPRVTSAETP
jgi:hypothetical protein